MTADLDPDDPRLKTFIFVMQAISLVSLYPGLALTVKRLHDRDQSGYVAGFLYLPLLVKEVTDLAGITGDPENPGPLDLPLDAIIFIVSIVVPHSSRLPARNRRTESIWRRPARYGRAAARHLAALTKAASTTFAAMRFA